MLQTGPKEIRSLYAQAFLGLVRFQVLLMVFMFIPAGTLAFWQAWTYWIVVSSCAFGQTIYSLAHDPELIRRRLRAGPAAEKEQVQKLVMWAATVFMAATLIIAGLDYRWQWSHVPVALVWAAEVVVIVGFVIDFFVFKENSYTASTVQVESQQPVIATGPYAIVRHPLYAGALVSLVATPVALGSWWAFAGIIPNAATIVVRLLAEEKYLSGNLRGYREYCGQVRWRLVPFVW